MRVMQVPDYESERFLAMSISTVEDRDRDLSARTLLRRGLTLTLAVVGVLLAIGLAISWADTVAAVFAAVTVVYIGVIAERLSLYVRSQRRATSIRVPLTTIRAEGTDDLPVYTVLVPLHREPEVVPRLVGHLRQIDYPRDRLDVIFLLESDDETTIAAVRNSDAEPCMKAVLVPPGGPRTKPKALNYGRLFARGEIVTIYDAEDRPEPAQLRKAALALKACPPDVACVQAKLAFWNIEQNAITKWFALEYSMWFWLFLPGLVDAGAPLPLGGTSNHFRRRVLDEIGGWDPYNVTEDADLGIRLSQFGYRCEVLEAVTLEEANSDFINWVKQRSRWYKGYLQTLFVHLRHPIRLYRRVGARGIRSLVLFVGGTPALALLNPVFWLMTLAWFAGGHSRFIRESFPGPVFYFALGSWVFGNFLAYYMTIMTCRLSRRPELIWAALLVPVYWVMMAVAAIKAAFQLIVTPNLWEKTTHGLDEPIPART